MRNVTLAVLAGGEGARMGRPKGELHVDGLPILEFLLRRFDWPGEKVLITAPGREHPPAYELFDRELIDAAGGEGPLRGIVTALDGADAEIVVVVTCDMPLVTRPMLDGLASALSSDGEALGVMTRPFPLAIRPAARELLTQRLQEGARSVYSLVSLPQFRGLDEPPDWPADVWTNLNDPSDLARFEAQRTVS